MAISSDQFFSVSLVPFSRNGWHGWAAAAWQQQPAFADLDAWLNDRRQEIILNLPCRTITRYETSQGTVYAKCMRGRNDAAVQNKEVISWLKWCLLKSRGQRIAQVTANMISKGHYCPKPVLGVRKRGKWGYPTELYVSEELSLPTLEECLLQNKKKAAQTELLQFAAEKLANFHLDKFVHGDFLARNTCLDWPSKKLYFLDNDRTRLWLCKPPFGRQRRNLAQFCFNLMLLDGGDHSPLPKAFLQAYADLRPDWNAARRQREVTLVMHQCQQRWDRDGSWEMILRERELQKERKPGK